MIYTKFGKQKTIKQFITKLYSQSHGYGFSSIETYSDSDCTEIQSYAMRVRSFDDVLECVNTYYKNVTPKRLMYILASMKLVKDGNNLYLFCFRCTEINKSTFLFYNEAHWTEKFNQKQKSQYSWEELFDMIGIKNKEDIINYRNNGKL